MAKPEFSFEVCGEIRVISFEIQGGVTTPVEFAEAIEEIASQLPGELPVVFSGRGPVWGYAMLVHMAHPAPWVGCYDPRLGVVVVASHSLDRKVGEVAVLPEPE